MLVEFCHSFSFSISFKLIFIQFNIYFSFGHFVSEAVHNITKQTNKHTIFNLNKFSVFTFYTAFHPSQRPLSIIIIGLCSVPGVAIVLYLHYIISPFTE